MDKKQAIQIIEQLQTIAIQKGLFQNAAAVNQVSMAIATLRADETITKP